MGYPQQYGYYGGYNYGQQATPQAQQPAAPAAAPTTDSSAWDPAAAAAYYQTSGWGGYYGQSPTPAPASSQDVVSLCDLVMIA